ncbi:MAG: GPP34 family phosphoprotein [Bacteroidales bacterium]|jgi:hypothetical protein|nr:GPP34 family phosphoprotein [Bacteroidales bacterium]
MENKVTEQFISLSLNPESGRYLVLGNYLTYGIIGALLMDLSLAGKIIIEGNKVMIARDNSMTGIPACDRMLKSISESGKERKIQVWVRRLGSRSAWYRKEMQKYFVKSGILKEEKKRFLFIPYRLHYVATPGVRKNLILRYKDIILYKKQPEEHEIMLMGLMYACRMHRILTKGGPERRKIRKRLVEIVKDNEFASGINKAIIEMQAAIAGAIAATAAMSAATSASGN